MARQRIVVDALECRPEQDPYRRDSGHQTYADFRLNPSRRVCAILQSSGAPGCGIPSEEYHRFVLTHRIGGDEYEGYPIESNVQQFLRGAEGQKLMRRVCDGHDRVFDGHNVVGTLTDDASAAWQTLCDTLDAHTERATYLDAGDWVQFNSDLGLTGHETDDDLAALAAEDERVAWESDRIVIGGLLDLYTEVRNDLR
jgi:hypothetical protein